MTNQICFVVFTLCYAHPAGHTLTHSGTCTRNQSASMSTFHFLLSTFHCCRCRCCCCFRKSFSQCKCKFAPRCMHHASPGRVSANAFRPGIPFSLSLSLSLLYVCPSVCCDFCNEVEVHVACLSCVPFVPAFVDVATFDRCKQRDTSLLS